jgi:hypothetical protein
MIVVIGRFKFLAMVCSGVFAFARAIKARSSFIDQGARPCSALNRAAGVRASRRQASAPEGNDAMAASASQAAVRPSNRRLRAIDDPQKRAGDHHSFNGDQRIATVSSW